MEIGSLDIVKLCVGGTQASAAYLGSAKVFPNEEPGQPLSEIWYTTTNGQPINLTNRTGFGANYVSDTYSDGKGIIKFDGSINAIPTSAFTSKGTLITISLPNGVVSIGDEAFRYCSGLTTIDMSSVKTIGSYAFNRCSGITYIDIPNIITISDDAFARCMSASTVNLGSGLTSIGIEAFVNSSGLTSINYDGTIAQFKNINKGRDWANFIGTVFVHCKDGDQMIFLNNRIIYSTSNGQTITPRNVSSFGVNTTSIVRAEYVNGWGNMTFSLDITKIPSNAFSGFTTLEKVYIPANVTTVYSSAFANDYNTNTNFKYVEFEDKGQTVTFNENVFNGDNYLEKVVIPAHFNYAGTVNPCNTFNNCRRLRSVNLPINISQIGGTMFNRCYAISEFEISSTVTTFNDSCFRFMMSLSSIKYNGTTSQWNSINKASMWDLWIPATTIQCSDGTVSHSDSFEVTLNNVSINLNTQNSMLCATSDGRLLTGYDSSKYALSKANPGDESVIMFSDNANITELYENTVSNSYNLFIIRIPNVTSIEADFIKNCPNLEYITFCGTKAEWQALWQAAIGSSTAVFHNCPKLNGVLCKDGELEVIDIEQPLDEI